MPVLESGQQLSARYVVRDCLSEGTLGETWRALDRQGNHEVIVKLLRPELVSSPGALASLAAELESAARVDSELIAGGYQVEREGDIVYLVRDYIAGHDLSALRGQPWHAILPAAIQVAEALAALHAASLVHRDVKASNAILRDGGSVSLIDLGSAAFAGDARAVNAGSPYSQSPQQLAGEPPSPADDAYAFGVLLYELLSGYPPFYPNITRERVTNESPPPVRTLHPAPPALTDLVTSLLDKDPAARPGPMSEIVQRLRVAGSAGEPDVEAVIRDGEDAAAAANRPKVTIIRPIVRPPAAARQSAAAGGSWRMRLLTGAGILLVVASVMGVFVALPRLAPKVETPPRIAVAPEKEAPKAPVDLEQLAMEMDRAEQVRGAYDSLLASLERRGAAEWAPRPFAAGRARGEEAQRQFAAREYEAARETYKAGLDFLQQTSDEATRVLNAQLERGARALESGQSKAAQEAFALALKVDPDNAAAGKGLKRSKSLDKVVAALAAAANAERDQSWATAQDYFRRALELDPETRAASEGVARMQSRIAADEFASAMSRGFASLNAGNLGEARSTFRRAGAIRPGAREVKDALDQVALAERLRKIAAHREQAESFVKEERWQDAIGEYDAALKLDPALEFALKGRAAAAPRAKLAHELDLIVKNPDRLLTAAVRQQARSLLDTARSFGAPGPVLRERIETVSTALQQAETPVRVALRSDNATQIAINRVGPLGAFEHREVVLSPGRYTVVGTRTGYRDVRRELTILPGQSPAPLVIRCEEPI